MAGWGCSYFAFHWRLIRYNTGMRNHKKLIRALLWFAAAGIFIYALLTTTEESYNARHNIEDAEVEQEQAE